MQGGQCESLKLYLDCMQCSCTDDVAEAMVDIMCSMHALTHLELDLAVLDRTATSNRIMEKLAALTQLDCLDLSATDHESHPCGIC